MKAFAALVHRELIEHRGAFLIGPLILVGIVLVVTLLAFTVGRVDTRVTGSMINVLPLAILFWGAMILAVAWGLYLLATLFFYCADGFAADKRNNAMLFWKSMPVSDFKVLLAKIVAAMTILPGAVLAIALLSIALMLGTAYVTMTINGATPILDVMGLPEVFFNVAMIAVVQLVCGLLWYLPYMALVGAIATVMGRWAIPVSLLLPALVSTLEWVTIGAAHPFATHSWRYLEYRSSMPEPGMVETWLTQAPLTVDVGGTGLAYGLDLIARMDWLQVGVGIGFSVLVLFIASEYRRRVNDN